MQNAAPETMERYHELLALMDGNQELLQELIDVFLEDAPQLMDLVRKALGDCDAGAVYRAAHTLKGSAGNFGAPAVVGLALGLEADAREGDLEAAAVHFGTLEAEIGRLTAELLAARDIS